MTATPPTKHLLLLLVLIGSIIAVLALPQTVTGPLQHNVDTVHDRGVAALKLSKTIVDGSRLDTTQPIHLLLLGRSGTGHAAPMLTDTIMLVSLFPNRPARPLVLSLPRDLLVQQPNGAVTKINHLYQQHGGGDQGRAAVSNAVARITGITPTDSLVVDLTAVQSIVDAVGGINIYVRDDLIDPQFPTSDRGTTTVRFNRGWRWMDGATATQYIRTRATPRGDFDRITRQQDVLQTLYHKVAGLHALWDMTTLLDIWTTLSDHIETDLSIADLRALWQRARAVDPAAVQHVFLDPSRTDLVIATTTPLRGVSAYTIVPRTGIGNYAAIRDYVQSLITDN